MAAQDTRSHAVSPTALDVNAETGTPVNPFDSRLVDCTRPSSGEPTARSAPAWSPLLAPGGLIDETFKLKRLLGRGGMAVVMLAQDLSLDRDVAIKFLGTNLVSDPMWRERFAIEARNMARVRHENVAQVFSYGIHEGWPYFVMEFVDGSTLADWIRKHPSPPVADVAAMVRRIAAGLAAIHDAGLVHHDIKPANVLIDGSGRIVVTDLGLSRVVSGFGGAGGAAGTPRYMAPEQISLEPIPPRMVARTDVYQLGVTAFELLVGVVPFDAATPAEIFERHRDTPPPQLSTLRPDLSEAVNRAVLKALEKDPEARHASPLAFAEALEEAAWLGSARHDKTGPPRPLRVLVTEDDEDQLLITCAVLRYGLPQGSQIEQARNGKEALAATEQQTFDVLVLDLHMPGMNGLDLATALATSERHHPHIIVVSGSGGAEDWRVLHGLGVEAMLLKPFNAEQLVAAIERVTR